MILQKQGNLESVKVLNVLFKKLNFNPDKDKFQALLKHKVTRDVMVIPGINEQKEPCIIKIRKKNNQKSEHWFKISLYINNLIFKEFDSRLLKTTIPKILAHGFSENLEYLIFEYKKGIILGNNRAYREIVGFEQNDLNCLKSVLKEFRKLPIDKITSDINNRSVDVEAIEKRIDQDFNNQFVQKEALIFLENSLVTSIRSIYKNWAKYKSQLMRNSKYLVHRDFKPYNFIKDQAKIYVIDFDVCGIGTKFYDALSLWSYLVKYPQLQLNWEKTFLKSIKLSRLDMQMYYFEKLYFIFNEINYSFEYFKKNQPIIRDINEIRNRLKKELKEIVMNQGSYFI